MPPEEAGLGGPLEAAAAAGDCGDARTAPLCVIAGVTAPGAVTIGALRGTDWDRDTGCVGRDDVDTLVTAAAAVLWPTFRIWYCPVSVLTRRWPA